MDLDPVLLSRLQFAWLIGWHILLPALGRRNHEAGAWKMHTDLADRGFVASDDDLMDARGDQFADDRIASGIVRSNADDLARLPPDGIFRVGGCFRD